MNNDIELDPCPFCGQIPEIMGEETDEPISVHCEQCDYDIGYFDTVEEAAEAWNTRKGETFTKDDAIWILNLPVSEYTNTTLYKSIIAKCKKILGIKY